MRWWRMFRPAPAGNVHHADEAIRQAEQALNRVRRQGPRVDDVASKLDEHLVRNNFGRQFLESMFRRK
jgi:hypothetical protein